MRPLFFCLVFFTPILSLVAQEKKLSLELKDVALTTILDQLESTFNIRFSYSDEVVSKEKLTIQFQDKTLSEILNYLNKKSDLNFEQVSNRNIVIQKVNTNNFSEITKTQALNEIIINEYLTKGIQKQKNGSYHFSPNELEILPGITEPDVFQSIQLLPGVISPDETSTNIHIRGGTPDQNLILWDGIKIYHTGHLFGTFSAFNPYIIKSINFINKGTNAKFGDRVSSVIDIKTNKDIVEKIKGGFGFNLIEFDAYLEAPIIKDKLSLLVSGRRSFTDFLVSNTFVKISDKIFQNQENKHVLKGDDKFFYLDYNVKLNWKIAKDNYLHFSFINIENNLKTSIEDQINGETIDKLETENQGYSLNWDKKWSPKWKQQTNIYFSKYALSFNHNLEENDDLPDVNKNASNKVKDLGLNLNFDYTVNNNQNLNFGYQFSNYNIKYAFEESRNEDILNSHTLYSSYSYKNKNLFDITGGIRFTLYDNINKMVAEPRINIFKKLNSNFSIQMTAERKTQAVSQISQTISQNITLENQIWTIANNNEIPIVKNWHYTGGVIYSKNNWNFEFDAYYKEIEGLTTLNNSFIDITDIKIQQGESRVIGADFYIEKHINKYKTSLSYTLSSIKNNFDEINENQSFPANADIKHNLNWSNEYIYKKFKFALGWRWHSGKPYSEAVGIKNDEIGNKILVYNGINSQRLMPYSRFDFSSTYNFTILKQNNVIGKIGVSVLNIFNNQNILNRTFTLDNSNNKINTIDTESLQRITNIIFRISW